MRKSVTIFTAMVALSMAACTHAPDSDKATTTDAKKETVNESAESYKVNVDESKIEWIGTKVSGYHTGTVKIKSGELMVTNGVLSGGTFVLDMSTIAATGPKEVNEEMCRKLTGHLQSPDFFDIQKFPVATFVITGVKPFTGTVKDVDDPRQQKLNEYKVNDPTHTVSGNLTVKGVTKNIEFPARITMGDKTVEAKSKFNIDRRQWGLVYPGKPDDLIRDDIYLGIYLKAAR